MYCCFFYHFMEFSQYLWVLINLYLIDILYQIIRFHFNHRVSKRKSGKYLHIFHVYLLVWQESRELCLMMVTSMICTKIINLNMVKKKNCAYDIGEENDHKKEISE